MPAKTRSAQVDVGDGLGAVAGGAVVGVADGRGVPATGVPHAAHRTSAASTIDPDRPGRRFDMRDGVNGGGGPPLRSIVTARSRLGWRRQLDVLQANLSPGDQL